MEVVRGGETPDMPLDDMGLRERLSDLMFKYGDRGLAFSQGQGRYTMRFTVEGENPTDAITDAMEVVYKAANECDLPQWPVIKAEVTEWDEFERELDRPTYPPVLGISEIGEQLGVSRQRASQIARRRDFPRPYAVLACGPVWLEPNVRRFVDNWDRKPEGPRKVPAVN